ncbi:unannotated protein [freshwater metagenome]|uniref:Unannotated protein n=1 Tax=freshwater metagenome TaxID=449393 RepID=A0A6J5ZDF3_9ZZZZ
MRFDGVWVPIITPFDEMGNVDRGKLADFVDIMIDQGVDGIVAVGTTGEAYALTIDERHAVISTVVKQTAGRVPVLAGVGGMSTTEAVDQAALGKRLGCQGLMVAAPAYALPTPDELAIHIKAVVSSVALPTALYDYPARTGTPFGIDVLDQLVGFDNINGIKEASGDLSRIATLTERFGDKLQIVCGADADCTTFMNAGVTSWIGGMANALPKAHSAIINADTREAAFNAVHPILEYIESGRYIAKTKALVSILGFETKAVRGPLQPATSQEIAELERLVEQAGEWVPRLA